MIHTEAWLQRVLRMPRAWAMVALVGAGVVLSVLVTLVATHLGGTPPEDLPRSITIAVVVPVLVGLPVVHALLGLLHALESARAEAQRLAHHDPLTGALNRRRFAELAAPALARDAHDGLPSAVLLLDLDDFKQLNDRVGHAGGDAVLVQVVRAATGVLRRGELFARWGGEEFAVVLPRADGDAALAVARRLVQALADLPATADGVRVTLSIGVAVRGQGDESLEALLQRADRALYAAKAAGKNTIEIA